jgi:hypothetical protein
MSKIYKQLSIEERETIQSGVWQKKSIRMIAKELGRCPATTTGLMFADSFLQIIRITDIPGFVILAFN